MAKILLVGNGAREHVVGETLKKGGAKLYTYGKAKNPGLLELSEDYYIGSLGDFEEMTEYARKIAPDFAFIGPDDPIGEGAVDALLEKEIKSVAPLKTVARLESSKSFTRDLVKKYGIPGNPEFQVFYDESGIGEFLDKLGENFVVKADGLMAGKGVKVGGEHLKDAEEALGYAKGCIAEAGKVVIEEKLAGPEFSLMAFCDGENIAPMPAVQDHKRAYDGDTGPNTGGMGSYSDANHSLPFLADSDIDEAVKIIELTAKALYHETGCSFKGIMYGGFMATASGIKLIEFNARFGDPEAMNVLPILNTNFVHVCEAIVNDDLGSLKLEFAPKATVCKYIVPEGYPENPQKGSIIEIKDVPKEVKMYYASVDLTPEGLTLSGSRAIGFVGIGNTIEAAEKIAASACSSIKGPVFFRTDIGTKALIEKRIDLIKQLRG
jgi:phosphoribosylamine--glycine ligase